MSPRINANTLLAISLAAGAALVSCTANRRRTPDDTLVMLIEAPMTTADPRFALTNYDAKLSRLVAPGLTSVDTPTAEARLELAASVERKDPLTIDVTLRDAKFSDGNPVRAEDVARTYETVMADACGSLYQKGFVERFKRVEVLDDKRARFHLVTPLATFMTDIEFGVISFHGVAPGECRPPKLIGAGPFVLRELTSRYVRLDANPHYRTPAKLAHVHIKFVRDAAARLLMLAGGSADLVQNAFRVDLVDDVTKRPRVRATAA